MIVTFKERSIINILIAYCNRRPLLQEQPTAAVTVAWRVWWAAGMDVALHKRAKVSQSLFNLHTTHTHTDTRTDTQYLGIFRISSR